MCFSYDEQAEFCDNSYRVARKDHKCECCGKKIPKGQQYEYTAGKFDGRFFQSKMCNLCSQDRLRIVMHELDEGCRWHEAWPGNAEDQRDWIHYSQDRFDRSDTIRDLNECRNELDNMYMNRQKKEPV